MIKKWLSIAGITLLTVACNNDPNNNSNDGTENTPKPAIPLLNYTIVNSYPHDTAAYTQGLAFNKGKLYQGTGSPDYSNWKSWMGEIDLKTGKPVRQVFMDKQFFGEGITILNSKIYQLTWQSKKVFVYDVTTFKKIEEFSWNYEGWGITHNGKELIISDGGSNLHFVDPGTFRILNIVGVTDVYGPVGNLNELEYINGYVYANRYTTDYIYKIDPASGKVVARADLKNVLLNNAPEWANDPKFQPGSSDGVLNGIAYDSASGKIYITGKLWPKLFEIKFND